MSFDLYEQENLEAVSNLPPVQDVEPSFFAGMSQVPKLAMRSLAVAGRAGSMAAASVPVLKDRLTGDTTLEDKYFKFHEDTFQSAVDYWTPRPNEVGTAAQVVGDLVTTLPMAIAAPPIALGSAYLGASEDLVRQGVDPLKAQAVGATQAAGFALGIWMPILGKNLWQRTVVGGAGFNVLQGAVTRGVSGEMLEGTPAEGQFKAFDGEAMTLDVLMGLGFGTFAHLSPSQRAQGEEAWNKISEWAQNMTPSQKAAVATLREAQHMNVDSTPGKPIDPSDIEAHVNRMRTAIDQIVNDQPVDVENILVPGRTKDEPDDPLKALSDTTLQAVGDLGPGREITRGVGVTDADWALLEKEGLVQEGTTEDGEKYHYVSTDADALVGERERRYQAEVQAIKNRTIDPEEQAAAVERRAANYERVAAEKTEAGYPDEADQLTAKAKELRAQAKAIRENALPHEPQFQPDPVREQENVERTRQMLDIAEQVRHDEGLPEVSQVGRTITERLMELGTPAQEAADKGLLWDTFFKSMESKTGEDAQQLFGKYFDRVFNAGEDLPDDAVMHGDVLAQGVKLGYPEDYGFVPDQPAPDEVTNSANIAALRRTAAGLERPEDGVTLHVTDDGRAIATGPKGTRVPETFVRFAQENGLKFMAQRQLGSVRPIITHGNIGDHYGSAMPVDYRAAGALYFNEMGKAFVDRTGRALFQSQFDLKAQTPEELAARAKDEELAQKGDLAAQKRQADRATADALRNEFKLTGSDRPADVAAAHGQQALFQMADRAHAKAIETPEFKRWFGDSKVVDAEGKPLVVYRGEGRGTEFNVFDRNATRENAFFFTDNKEIAQIYANRGEPRAFYLKSEKLLDLTKGKEATDFIRKWAKVWSDWTDRVSGEEVDPVEYVQSGRLFDYEGDWSSERWKDLQATIEAEGYDGAVLPDWDNERGQFSAIVVFRPEQIKSAIGNRGTFDPNDPNILKQSAPVFYSQLSKSIEDAPAKVFGTGKQLKEWMTANAGKLGVKKDEIEATGLNDWLSLQGKVSKEQVQEFLANNGVKVEEVTLGGMPGDVAKRQIFEKWAPLIEEQQRLMDDTGTGKDEQRRSALAEHERLVDAREREVAEAGGNDTETKFATYQLPGGENYRELLLTLPAKPEAHKTYGQLGTEMFGKPWDDLTTKEQNEVADRMNSAVATGNKFKSSHYPDQPNILAHIRFNERTDADGKRVLFLEELQSDWAQKGRKEGFKPNNEAPITDADRQAAKEYFDVRPDFWEKASNEDKDAYVRDMRDRNEKKLVPSAPFVTDTKAWVALALKRMIRYAAENGFDRIAWTNGEQQAARYDLSKQVDAVRVVKKENGNFNLEVTKDEGRGTHAILASEKNIDLRRVEDLVGKDLAKKISEQQKFEQEYTGLDLKVGGEGMKGFYDQIVPQVANDVLKKLGGGKVGEVTLPAIAKDKGTGWESTDAQVTDVPESKQPGFDITPELREKVMAGLPLFQKTGDGARGFLEFGQNGKMGIGLLASADKSTFLHESGHFFLEVMNDLSNEANAPPELRADMQAIHEWMGVSREQWASMSLEQKRPYHEQWTRGFEQYLMEGKAPTSRLKEAFARFRDWLIEIYKSATALNVTLSDDVRKVMDNMLTVKESEPRQSPTGDGVPPPRASIGEDSAGNSDLDKALTSGEPLLDKIRPLDDPDLVATLQDMAANEAGWAEKGGNLMREFGDEGEVTGRTQWIPKAEWWPDRPGAGKANRKLNEAQVAEAVRKHLAGEPLKSLELQTVEYMSKIANDRLNSVEMIGDQEFGNTMQDWVAESVEPTTEKVFDSQAVARALDLNPEATMQAMERYDIHDDDAIIMAEIRSIIDEAGQQSLETAQGRAEDTGKEADPIQSEAERIVAEDPERRIPIGTGPDGEAVTLTAREYLDQARAQADQARQDVNLIKAAAECLLGQI